MAELPIKTNSLRTRARVFEKKVNVERECLLYLYGNGFPHLEDTSAALATKAVFVLFTQGLKFLWWINAVPSAQLNSSRVMLMERKNKFSSFKCGAAGLCVCVCESERKREESRFILQSCKHQDSSFTTMAEQFDNFSLLLLMLLNACSLTATQPHIVCAQRGNETQTSCSPRVKAPAWFSNQDDKTTPRAT